MILHVENKVVRQTFLRHVGAIQVSLRVSCCIAFTSAAQFK